MLNTSLSLAFTPGKLGQYHNPPNPGFSIGGRLKNDGAAALAILGFSYSVRTSDHIRVQPEVNLPVTEVPVRLDLGETVEIYLPVTPTRDVLDAIEEKRQGAGEVTLTITAHVSAALLRPLKEGNQTVAWIGDPFKMAVNVTNPEGGRDTYRVSRDLWLSLLQSFKYSELDVFELPRLALKNILPDAVTRARAAEHAFRNGDWRGTLEETRFAFEAVAKATAQHGQTKIAFEKLWEALVPRTTDGPRRKALDEIAGALNGYQQLGRHPSFPTIEIDRHDALLALRLTLAMFAYMGERAERPLK